MAKPPRFLKPRRFVFARNQSMSKIMNKIIIEAKIITLAVFIFILLPSSITFAEIRYVSPNGSNEAPYTSWATASNEIQNCIENSVFGDTIYVGAGTYKESLVLSQGLSLIGAGIDSTIVDYSWHLNEGWVISVRDSCLVSNITFIAHGGYTHYQEVMEILDMENGTTNVLVENIRTIGGSSYAIAGEGVYGTIRNSILTNTRYGIRISGSFNWLKMIYENNYIYVNHIGIGVNWPYGPKTIMRYNTIIGPHEEMFRSYETDSIMIYNNLFYANVYNAEEAIAAGKYFMKIFNNVIYARPGVLLKRGIMVYDSQPQIFNNIIVGTQYGIESRDGEANTNIRYNNFWKTGQDFLNFPHDPDSTNMHVDPMFVDVYNKDLHLQLYSPMIDAGDPDVLDVDGTRSDLGYYGGPYGESYRYQDLAPAKPQSLVHDVIDSLVTLNWELNTEADFSHYQVDVYYDDVHSGGIIHHDSARFADILPAGIDKALYTIISIDNHGNESDTTSFSISLVNMKEKHEDTHGFRLNHNYPNPFNPKTNISFYIEESSRARVSIYNSNGELIDEIFNREVERGYYSVPYTPEVASGIYLYRLEVRQNNVIVFADMGKMVYLK